jgi:thiamine-monophosphate kinase
MKSETDFLRGLKERFATGLPGGTVGIGDDAAVIERDESSSWVVTTDLLVEGVDFLRAKSSPESVGFKSLAVSLSDVAAMGAEPRFAFLSLGVPAELPDAWVKAFYDGFEEAMLPARVLLLGGDTSRVPAQIAVNVCVIGEAPTEEIKLRSRGRPGDVLFVTGALGDAAAGLELLLGADAKLATFRATREGRALVSRLERPRPHLAEGRFLGARSSVTSLMDLSDGLAADLPKLCEASGVGAAVEIASVPLSPELKAWAAAVGGDAALLAARGGEDFVLLGSCRAAEWPTLASEFRNAFGRELPRIGAMRDGSGAAWTREGAAVRALTPGFEHFGSRT